jgi:hypothetical protein
LFRLGLAIAMLSVTLLGWTLALGASHGVQSLGKACPRC